MWKRKKLPFDMLFGLVDVYCNSEHSVKDISKLMGIKYKDIWIYMNQAVDAGIISKEKYKEAYNHKNSIARTEEKNPNYNGVLLTDKVIEKISNSMNGKTIPEDVRDKISKTKTLSADEHLALVIQYCCTRDPVSKIAEDMGIGYRLVGRYMKKAIPYIISEREYNEAYLEKLSNPKSGEKNPNCTLTKEKIRKFALDYINSDILVPQLAKFYHVHPKNIYKIMDVAINLEFITRIQYEKAYKRKNSLSNKGKIIPEKVRNKISETMKKNGKSLADKI